MCVRERVNDKFFYDFPNRLIDILLNSTRWIDIFHIVEVDASFHVRHHTQPWCDISDTYSLDPADHRRAQSPPTTAETWRHRASPPPTARRRRGASKPGRSAGRLGGWAWAVRSLSLLLALRIAGGGADRLGRAPDRRRRHARATSISARARRCRSCASIMRRLGTPHRDAAGQIDNAVMVLHGTGGSRPPVPRARNSPTSCTAPGQPLDLARYYIILPDGIGHGRSSKPSDGLSMRFPHYDYDDMVEAQRLMLAAARRRPPAAADGHVDGLHARLRLGREPSRFASARSCRWPACRPRSPAATGCGAGWRSRASAATPPGPGGNYTAEPLQGLRTAVILLQVAGMAPLYAAARPIRPARPPTPISSSGVERDIARPATPTT